MKRKNILYWAAVSVLGGSLIISQVNADSGSTPGSDQDPVVSKSYVDELFNQLKGGSPSTGGSAAGLTVVTLQNGQKLMGVNGTEIIVRGGKATAITTAQGGLSDVTSAVDIKQGENVPANHHIIVPVNDGRGIKATANNTYVLVRGTYTVE